MHRSSDLEKAGRLCFQREMESENPPTGDVVGLESEKKGYEQLPSVQENGVMLEKVIGTPDGNRGSSVPSEESETVKTEEVVEISKNPVQTNGLNVSKVCFCKCFLAVYIGFRSS